MGVEHRVGLAETLHWCYSFESHWHDPDDSLPGASTDQSFKKALSCPLTERFLPCAC
jgi:hypothetical protein